MQIGFIGLGKMGSRMVGKLIAEGHNVLVWNRSQKTIEEFKIQSSKFKIAGQNLKVSETVQELVGQLDKQRVIWLMLPAGEVTDAMVTQVLSFLEKGDILINGANEHFENTEKHAKQCKEKGVQFLGIGVSGGIIAAEKGYPLMVGGDKEAYELVKPILDSLSKPHGGHEYFGTGGAGHYIKMVHNAIEYGYMQSIGEGFGVLQKAEYNFDLTKVAKLYQKGTLVSGFMMDRTVDALTDPEFESIQGVIGKASGETIWTVEEAKKKNVFIEIIEASLQFRNRSETDSKVQSSFAAKLVSALRKAFGGHAVKK